VKIRSQKSGVRTWKWQARLLLIFACSITRAEPFEQLCADRTAVERVYYSHRLGNKPPFEQELPPALVQKLVRADLHKEAVVKSAYGISITPAMLANEVQRINVTTRAPEICSFD